ncbi:MAG: hypothetical protein IJ728_12690 [Selenomonadaceae bacterium]|nr:hypothetical protein [Selenomonadaceae bacterium]
MLNEINWPHEYLPGTTDNFASNEIIVKGITAQDVFENLIDTSIWTTYYKNASDIEFYRKCAEKHLDLSMVRKGAKKTLAF